MSDLEAEPCDVCGEYPTRDLGAAGYWYMYSDCEHREDQGPCYSEEEVVHEWNTNGKGGHYFCDKHNRKTEYYHESMDEGFDCGCWNPRWVGNT